jgi:molecular chaperone DnaJ
VTAQREWLEKDYYAVLGVAKEATDKEITKAYRKLARQLHPDANPGDAAAEERFKEVSAAYDVVGDADRRTEYDEVRAMGPFAFGGGAGGPGGSGPGGMGGFRVEDLGDLFGGLFGGGAGGGRDAGFASGGPRAAQRGDDLETELHLSFLDATHGVTTSVHLTSDAGCRTCGGTGAAPGTTPVVCATCQGSGAVSDNQGMFGFSQPCPACGGRGQRIESPCGTCHGSGLERRRREVKVRIPAGVEDGQRIRLKGRGGPGRGGPAGDLYVVCRVAPHPVFGRSGDHLTVTVPITFPEAALGATVRVPTLEGDTVGIKVPAGTSSGRVFRLRGKGIESKKGSGDLLATVEVAVPLDMSEEAREALRAYDELSAHAPREATAS